VRAGASNCRKHKLGTWKVPIHIVEGVNCAVVLSFGKKRKAAAVVSEDIIWIDSNCLIIVGYSSIVVSLTVVGVSTTKE
jgi:hypothetical protein